MDTVYSATPMELSTMYARTRIPVLEYRSSGGREASPLNTSAPPPPPNSLDPLFHHSANLIREGLPWHSNLKLNIFPGGPPYMYFPVIPWAVYIFSYCRVNGEVMCVMVRAPFLMSLESPILDCGSMEDQHVRGSVLPQFNVSIFSIREL